MVVMLSGVVGAIVAGALAKANELGGQAAMDAYDALKALIIRKLGKAGALQSVEDEPQSETAQTMLAEALARAGLGRDHELARCADVLQATLSHVGQPDSADIEVGSVIGRVNVLVSNLIASGRIKLGNVIAESGDATVTNLQAGAIQPKSPGGDEPGQPFPALDSRPDPELTSLAGVHIGWVHAGRDVFIQPLEATHFRRETSRLTVRPTVFVKRSPQIELLRERLSLALERGQATAVVLRGPQGIGKSTIADEICDELVRLGIGGRTVHRVAARSNADLAAIGPTALVFVDGFMDEAPRSDAEPWLRTCRASFFIFTTRRRESVDAIRSALRGRNVMVECIDVPGLDEATFFAAIGACRNLPGCAAAELDHETLHELFEKTGGSPLAIQLALDLFSCPVFDENVFAFAFELHPAEVIERLILNWRRKIVTPDDDVHRILLALSNVSSIGLSPDAISFCLSWPETRVRDAVGRLWVRGFLSQVLDHDGALAAHDSIRKAFTAGQSDEAAVALMKKRHLEYAFKGSKTSAISTVDSLIALSEYLFSELRDADSETLDFVDIYSVHASLRTIQAMITNAHFRSPAQTMEFGRWLAEYLKKNERKLKCNEVIAIGGLAVLMPDPDPLIGDAFTAFWEPGTETDPTKVTAALPASLRHWEPSIRVAPSSVRDRVLSAWSRQPWGRFSATAELVAAAFAAAYLRVKQTFPQGTGSGLGVALYRTDSSIDLVEHTSLVSAFLSGWQIRGRGIRHEEGFAAVLLTLETVADHSLVDRFLHFHGHFCREVDVVSSVYLRARGLCCTARHPPPVVETNLNRNLLLAEWSGNSRYFEFVQRLMRVAEKRGLRPPMFKVSSDQLMEALVGVP